MYNSNRDILPGVNACLFTVKRKKKGSPAICDDFFAVSTLFFEDTDRRYDALLHTVDLWGLLGSMSKGFLLHYTCCDLIMLISCVALGCVDDV